MVRPLLALLVMLSTSASASDWKEFEKSDGVISYLDLDSLMKDETTYTVWLKSVYAKPQKIKQKASGAVYFHKLELMHVNCSGRSYFIEKTVYLTKDGTPVSTKKAETGPETVLPDSPAEIRYDAICKMRFAASRALMNTGVRFTPLEEKPKPKWWNPFAK